MADTIRVPESQKSLQIMSDLTTYMKYARYNPDIERREVWDEIVDRNMNMHIRKYPHLEETIKYVYNNFVKPKIVVPSMRSFQFAGAPIEINNARMFNCSFMNVDDPKAFSETMFLLLSGCGVGYSVQYQHINQLPTIKGAKKPEGRKRKQRYLVGDSIEGWADAIRMLVKSWFNGDREIEFDFRDIRPKGTPLITAGGKAPGPAPLRECIAQITNVFENAVAERGEDTQLKPIEAHDIQCYIADAVLSGGIRRSAMISLFSPEDEEMLTAKSGTWYETEGQRARANNSAVLVRDKVKKETFDYIWHTIERNGSGEPGFFFTSDEEGKYGVNPCAEISLLDMGFCNLSEVNTGMVHTQEEFNDAAWAGGFIGTLQAGYTDFHYLREQWKINAEEEALLGVSLTGIASNTIRDLDVKEAARWANKANEDYAEKVGVNVAKRVTCVKPSGTASTVLGTSSGIHAWHNDYYIRRIRVNKDEPIYTYLWMNHPELIEDEAYQPDKTAVISLPVKAPDGAVTRADETALDLLERVKWIQNDWVSEGHREGPNKHNVSVTVSLRDHEWGPVGEWMWENRHLYTGVSVLPYFPAKGYAQLPFEDIEDSWFVPHTVKPYIDEEATIEENREDVQIYKRSDVEQDGVIDKSLLQKLLPGDEFTLPDGTTAVVTDDVYFETGPEIYERTLNNLRDFNPRNVHEVVDNTNLMGELACAGGACEIT